MFAWDCTDNGDVYFIKQQQQRNRAYSRLLWAPIEEEAVGQIVEPTGYRSDPILTTLFTRRTAGARVYLHTDCRVWNSFIADMG